MGGSPRKKQLLNKTLVFIANVLNSLNVKWFIGYGTLLGIVRSQSCIYNDDDIDIICSYKNYTTLIHLGIQYDFNVLIYPRVVRFENSMFSPIDFYCADIEDGNFNDKHENVIWTNCYPLIRKKWHNTILNLPNDYETKLARRYGDDWKTPKKSKGNRKLKYL